MEEDEDICRVCRSGGTSDNPLFHPCICTGSIRYVHQECLLQWIGHSSKENCELCNYKYTFQPIYSPDMPKQLPLQELFYGLMASVWSGVKCWLRYTIVAIVWLGIVPLIAARIYTCVFAGSISALTSLPKNMFSPNNIKSDLLIGYTVLACSFAAFVCLLFLRVQILNGELPPWLIPRHRQNREQRQHNLANDQENEPDNETLNMQIANEHQVDNNNNNNENDQIEEDGDPALAPDPVIDGNIDWNAFDWEPADDGQPAWEIALGLDGSLIFIERVFWVLALNTLFILIFAFCPYHLGHFFMYIFDLNAYIEPTHFEGLLTTLCGYVLIACVFLAGHITMQLSKFHWPGWLFGLGYIVLKVGLLAVVELGVFPLACGVWLDICTLKIFNSSLEIRRENYFRSPAFSLVTHWLAGILFVFYFATFLMLLREVLRPGVLWFLRNLNDPDFNPINEMIRLSMLRHFRRFLLTSIIFGFTIIIIAWCPVQFLMYAFPNLLPYRAEIPMLLPLGEFPWQVLAVQVFVPGFLEFANAKAMVKLVVRLWTTIIGNFLGLRSYLLGDDNAVQHPNIAAAEHNDNARNEWNIHQPYFKPSHFPVRLVALFVLLILSLITVSATLLALPVLIGRAALTFIFSFLDLPNLLPDVYTFIFGIYFIWGCFRLYWIAATWAPRGWHRIKMKLFDTFKIFLKGCILIFFVFFIIPILLGLLFDFALLIPLRTSLDQSPVIILWQDWTLGIFLLKGTVAFILIGPNFWLKEDIERVYQQGLRHLPIFEFIKITLLPIVSGLLMTLCLPYAIGHIIPSVWQCSISSESLLKWRSHFFLVISSAIIAFARYEWRQFILFCDQIKNERYLIGRRLQDYEPPGTAI